MVKKNAPLADLAALDEKIAKNVTASATAAAKYNALHDAKVKIEEAEREKLLAKQKKEELEAAKAEMEWLKVKLTIFDKEKVRLTILLASGKDEEGKPQTAATTADITTRKVLFEKVIVGTK